MKNLLCTLVIAMSALALTSCGQKGASSGASSRGSKVVVTAIIPLTGDVATYGESLKRGFDVALAPYQDKITLQYEDSQANPGVALTAYRKAFSVSRSRFILGDATSGVCLALAPEVQKDGNLMMIAIATADKLSDVGSLILRNAPANALQAETAAKYLLTARSFKRIAIVCKQSEYGVNLADTFRKALAAANITPVLDEAYDPNTREFSDLVAKIAQSHAEAVFVPGNYEETAALLRRARETGSKALFLGTDGSYSPQLVALAGAAAEGYLLTMMPIDHASPAYTKFAGAYQAAHHAEPDVFSAYGYEGASLLFQAIAQAGEPAPQAVHDYLIANKWSTLTGDASFNSKGQFDRGYGIYEVKGGAFQPM